MFFFLKGRFLRRESESEKRGGLSLNKQLTSRKISSGIESLIRQRTGNKITASSPRHKAAVDIFHPRKAETEK